MNKHRVAASIVIAATLGTLGAVRGAGAAEPLRIGVPVIFSGPGAFVGAAQKRTLEMQAEALNAGGGVGEAARSNWSSTTPRASPTSPCACSTA